MLCSMQDLCEPFHVLPSPLEQLSSWKSQNVHTNLYEKTTLHCLWLKLSSIWVNFGINSSHPIFTMESQSIFPGLWSLPPTSMISPFERQQPQQPPLPPLRTCFWWNTDQSLQKGEEEESQGGRSRLSVCPTTESYPEANHGSWLAKKIITLPKVGSS